MRTFKVGPVIAACVAFCATPLTASAQQPDHDAPPRLERLEEGGEPAVTIRQPGSSNTITEKRAPGGRVNEIAVTHGKSTYYLRGNDPVAGVTGGGSGTGTRAAQWQVLEFNNPDSEKDRQAKSAQAAASAPPPPAAPAEK